MGTKGIPGDRQPEKLSREPREGQLRARSSAAGNRLARTAKDRDTKTKINQSGVDREEDC